MQLSRKRERELSPLMQMIQDGDTFSMKRLLKDDVDLLTCHETQKEALLFALEQKMRSPTLIDVMLEQCFGSDAHAKLQLLLKVYPDSDFASLKPFLPDDLSLGNLILIADTTHEPVFEHYCKVWRLESSFSKFREQLKDISKWMKQIEEEQTLKKPYNKLCKRIVELFADVAEKGELQLVKMFSELPYLEFGNCLRVETWAMPKDNDFDNMPLCAAICAGMFDCFLYLVQHLPRYNGKRLEVSDINVRQGNILVLACDFHQLKIAKWISQNCPFLLPSLADHFHSATLFCEIYDKVPLDQKQFVNAINSMCKEQSITKEQLDWFFNLENHRLHTLPTNFALPMLRQAVLRSNVMICKYILENQLVDNDKDNAVALLTRIPVLLPSSAPKRMMVYQGPALSSMPGYATYDDINAHLLEIAAAMNYQPVRELIFMFMREYLLLDFKWNIDSIFSSSSSSFPSDSGIGLFNLLLQFNVKFNMYDISSLSKNNAMVLQLCWHRSLMRQLYSTLFRFVPIPTFVEEVGGFLYLEHDSCVDSLCDSSPD